MISAGREDKVEASIEAPSHQDVLHCASRCLVGLHQPNLTHWGRTATRNLQTPMSWLRERGGGGAGGRTEEHHHHQEAI